MRKLLLTAMVLAAGIANAQYYSLSFVNAGENPGGVNSDVEQTWGVISGIGGYAQVLAPGETGWSDQQTLPFSFNFNGNDYTQYYVAASGVVTFESTLGAAPGSTNGSLPDASIPDNSVCAWGMNLSGANDAVAAKTFGTAPNRQHWVIWASASESGVTGASAWTYWGIVLEETSNKVYIVDMRTYSSGGGNTSLSVGLQFDNSSAVEISASPNVSSTTTATGGNGDDASDNTYYMFAPGVQPAVDLNLVTVSAPKYVTSSSPGSITGTVLNLGANAVSSFDVTWSDGTNTYTTTVGGNVNSGSYKSFTCSDPVAVNAGDISNITVEAVIAGDADLSNNSADLSVSGAAFIPEKVVVGEEATGTWCGWCPRGHVYMEYMEETYEDTWIGVAVHNSDPMENSTYDTWMGTQIGGYPSGVVDREGIDSDPTDFEARYNELINEFGVADISVEGYINIDGEATVDISAHFAVSSTDEFRLAAVLIEDGVTGTGGDWDQVNYYSFQSQNIALNGAGHDWQSATNPVPAEDMVYNDVGRELMGGINGDAGSVPATVAADDIVDYSYEFDWNEDYVVENSRAAALLIDQATGRILNAGETHFAYEIMMDGEMLLVQDGDTFELWDGAWVPLGTAGVKTAHISVYPNPATSFVTIGGVSGLTNVKVYDMRGSLVMESNIESNTLDIRTLNQGAYNIVINNNGNVANETIMIAQ